MAFWDNVSRFTGNLTRGVIGESDEERRRKQQQEAAARQAMRSEASRQQAPAGIRRPAPSYQTPQRPQNVQQPQPVQMPNVIREAAAQVNKPVQAPRAKAPSVNLADLVSRAKQANTTPVSTNEYYKRDLDKLNREVGKKSEADPAFMKGLLQSLENRRKEIQENRAPKPNVVEEFSTGVGGTIRDIAQAVPRGIKTLGVSIDRDKEWKPTTRLERTIYGDEPIRDVTGTGRDIVNDIDSIRTGKQSTVGNNLPAPVLALLGTGIAASDALGIGGVRRKAAKDAKIVAAEIAEQQRLQGIEMTKQQEAELVRKVEERMNTQRIEQPAPNEPAINRTQKPTTATANRLPDSPWDEPAVNRAGEPRPTTPNASRETLWDEPAFMRRQAEANAVAGKADAQVADLARVTAANDADLTKAVDASGQRIATAGDAANAAPVTPTPDTPVPTGNSAGDINAAKLPDDPLGDTGYVEGQQSLERMAGNKTIDRLVPGRQALRVPSKLNKPVDAVADALTGGTATNAGKLLTSQNRVGNIIGQFLYGMNQKSTLSTPEKVIVEQFMGRRGGQGNLLQQVRDKLEAPLKQLDPTVATSVKQRVFEAMSKVTDGRKFGDQSLVDEGMATIDSFNPLERQYFDSVRELNLLRNNLNRGVISDEVLQQGADGLHMPRIYDTDAFAKELNMDETDMLETYAMTQSRTLDLNPNKRRKQLDQIKEELQEKMLRDPAEASLIRTDIALHNRAVREYAEQVAQQPRAISDGKSRGYIPVPDNPKFGALSGQYVRKDLADKMLTGKDRYESQLYQKTAAVIDQIQGSALGKVEGFLRQTLTVFNPATRLGNRGANITMAQLAGFNVPEMAYRQQHYLSSLTNGGDEMTRLAQTYGAIDNTDALARHSGVVNAADPNSWIGKRQESYQNVDTAAKVAMFEWQLRKGASPEDAARFVNRALPNIANSGEIYRFFSRLPILGVPFRAIQPEVFRALGSNATRHSVPFLTAMAAYTTFQNWTWEEIDPEERRQIEERFGAGRTPFAKVNDFVEEKTGVKADKVLPNTWSFNAGRIGRMVGANEGNDIVEVDPRRLMGMYSINTNADTTGGTLDEIKKVSPAPIPIKYEDGKISFQPQEYVGSRIGQPIWQTLIDRDFRGKSIQDPEGKIYNDDGTVDMPFVNKDTLQPEAKSDLGRVGQSLIRSWLPQLNDIGNIYDAHQGQKTFHGQNMTPGQAWARLTGLKGEQFTDERLKDMSETTAYFADRDAIQAEAAKMAPSDAEAYKRASGYYNLREKVDNPFNPGEQRWKNAPVYGFPEDKYKDLSQNPAMYDLVKMRKEKDAARSGAPISPVFDNRLSEEFRRQLVANKAVAPGDNAELDQRMYSHPEWEAYQRIQQEYKDKAAKYYPQSDDDDFTDELVKSNNAKFPEKPPVKKAYDDAYKAYNAGIGPKPAFDDSIEAAKAEYETAKWNWTNNERIKRGLPLIPKQIWDNVTFGFEDDEEKVYKELKYGKGYGGFGKGGRKRDDNWQDDRNKLNYITDLANSGGDVDNAPRHRKNFSLTGDKTLEAARRVSKGSGRKITFKA